MINNSGKNIDDLGSFIYVYTTRTYMKLNYFKIGGTDNQTVRTRINQQDTTSTAEELIISRVYNLKNTRFYGNSDAAERFLRKGLIKTRTDKDREWRIVDIEKLDEKAKTLDKDITKNDIELFIHQVDALNFIKEKIKVFDDILLHHVPRSGKSYITIKYLSENKFKNVLFLTSIPILNQQWITLINKTKGFEDVIVLNFSNTDDYHNFVDNGYDTTKRYIFFVSFQDMKGNGDILDKEKFKNFRHIQFDLIIIDEVHKGVITKKSDNIFEILKYKKLLGLSATPTKNLIRGTFNKDNTHRFSVKNMSEYKKLYPDQYKNIPSIMYYLYNINKLHREELKNFYKNEENFTWNKFLRVENGKLKYKNLVRSFLLKHFAGDIGHDNSPIIKFNPTSALIFAEHNDSLKLIKELLDSIPLIGDNYDTHFTNSEVNSSSELMELIEGDFKPVPGKGSIIIANRQLTTGITLRRVDMVVFMNDWASMDEYTQASYRCLTATKGKKIGYVIDYLPSRSFNIMYQLIENETKVKSVPFEQSTKEYFKCVPIHLYDNNQFNKIDIDTFMEELITSLNIKNVFNYSTLLSDQISKYHDILESFGDVGESSKINVSKKLDEDSDDKGKNKKITKIISEKSEKIETLKNAIENARYILDRTLLLSLYTEFKYDNIDNIFDYIKTKEKLINIYLQSIMIDNVDIDIIRFVYDNCFDKKIINKKLIFINKIFIDLISEKNIIKRIMNIQKIQELINSYLGVSEIEKKKLGEVFTPFTLIREMLDTLPEEVWSDPKLKWGDFANGIGNFPAIVVERLMEGLKQWEPDEEKRYKHIIENMIYVCDIQPKNMFIYLMLFDPSRKYKMNYYTGSFLDEGFDDWMKGEWRIDGFDIIVGNPPYQEMDGGFGNSAQPIYNKFVDKSLKITEILLFITPSRWFITGKGLDDFRKMMLNRNDIVSINHFPKSKNVFNNVEIKGGVSYFLIDKKYNGDIKFNGEKISNNFNKKLDMLLDNNKKQKIISKTLNNNQFFDKYVEKMNYFGKRCKNK